MVGPVKVLATPAMPPPTVWLLLFPVTVDGGWRGVVRILLIKFTAWLAGAAFTAAFCCCVGNGTAVLPGSTGWIALIGLVAPAAGLLTPLFRPLLAFKPLLAGLFGSNGTLDCC